MIVDVPKSAERVRPHRRQHSKALLLRGDSFILTQHGLAEFVWIPAFEVQSKRYVAICVDLVTRNHDTPITLPVIERGGEEMSEYA